MLDFTDGRGADVVCEHVGAATWARSIELVAPWGTIVSAGLTSGALLGKIMVAIAQ